MGYMSIASVFHTSISLPHALFIEVYLFWGIRCRLSTTRANDDVLFLRGCARAKCEAMFFQKLPIYLKMAPIWGIILFSNSAAAATVHASDVTRRMRERLDGNPWNVPDAAQTRWASCA